MMPDYVLFVEPYSSITFKLCFVEFKRKGDHYKGNYESDLVKLVSISSYYKGLSTRKPLVYLLKKVNIFVEATILSPIYVVDNVATAFKIYLKYNDQYRMMRISEFNFIRKTPDDILLLPTIMEKLNQIKVILFNTISTYSTDVLGVGDHWQYPEEPL